MNNNRLEQQQQTLDMIACNTHDKVHMIKYKNSTLKPNYKYLSVVSESKEIQYKMQT